MRSIELKILPGPDNLPAMGYSNILKEVLTRPANPEKGADIQEMRMAIRVLDVLERSNGTLELEDADYEFVRERILNMHWNVIDRRIVQFVGDVTGR
jgi:hypothetical protein